MTYMTFMCVITIFRLYNNDNTHEAISSYNVVAICSLFVYHLLIYIYIYIYVFYIYIYIYLYICKYIFIFLYIFLYIFIFIYIYICVYGIYLYIYMFLKKTHVKTSNKNGLDFFHFD